jgi:hypothetical protein
MTLENSKIITEELEAKLKARIKEVTPELSDEKFNEIFVSIDEVIKGFLGFK